MPDPQWPKATEAKRASNGYLYSKPLASGKDRFDWGPDHQAESGTADYQVVDWAAGELKPFFHAVGIFRPHSFGFS